MATDNKIDRLARQLRAARSECKLGHARKIAKDFINAPESFFTELPQRSLQMVPGADVDDRVLVTDEAASATPLWAVSEAIGAWRSESESRLSAADAADLAVRVTAAIWEHTDLGKKIARLTIPGPPERVDLFIGDERVASSDMDRNAAAADADDVRSGEDRIRRLVEELGSGPAIPYVWNTPYAGNSGAPSDADMLTPAYRREVEVEQAVAFIDSIDAAMVRVQSRTKRPTSSSWMTDDLTAEDAVQHVMDGGNLAINLERSKMIVIDSPGEATTAALRRMGLRPTVATPRGGMHFWLKVPEHVKTAIPGGHRRIDLPEGTVEVLSGFRYVLTPPSAVGGSTYRFEFPVTPKSWKNLITLPPSWMLSTAADSPDGAGDLAGMLDPTKTWASLARDVRVPSLAYAGGPIDPLKPIDPAEARPGDIVMFGRQTAVYAGHDEVVTVEPGDTSPRARKLRDLDWDGAAKFFRASTD